MTKMRRLRIAGAYHLDFSDLSRVSRLFRLLGLFGPIAPDRSQVIINRYTTAFFSRHLSGGDESLLDAPSPEFPEVTIQVRN